MNVSNHCKQLNNKHSLKPIEELRRDEVHIVRTGEQDQVSELGVQNLHQLRHGHVVHAHIVPKVGRTSDTLHGDQASKDLLVPELGTVAERDDEDVQVRPSVAHATVDPLK